MEALKKSVAFVIASMDSVSIVVFTWRYFYIYQPWFLPLPISMLLFSISICSVFLLTYHATYRNTAKISKIPKGIEATGMKGVLHVFFAGLQALMAYILKRFALSLLFPHTPVIFYYARHLLPIAYAIYTFLNTLADIDRSVADLKYPRDEPEFNHIFSKPKAEVMLTVLLVLASMYTCHYKMMALNISVAGLVQQHQSSFRLLRYTIRFLFFPMMIVAYNNVFRCVNRLKNIKDYKKWDYQQYLGLMVISLASYTSAVSSKLLSLTPETPIALPIICLDQISRNSRQNLSLFNLTSTEEKQ